MYKVAFGLSGPWPSEVISGHRTPAPIKVSTNSTSSYFKFSHYDNVHITFNGLQVI